MAVLVLLEADTILHSIVTPDDRWNHSHRPPAQAREGRLRWPPGEQGELSGLAEAIGQDPHPGALLQLLCAHEEADRDAKGDRYSLLQGQSRAHVGGKFDHNCLLILSKQSS